MATYNTYEELDIITIPAHNHVEIKDADGNAKAKSDATRPYDRKLDLSKKLTPNAKYPIEVIFTEDSVAKNTHFESTDEDF
jgi:hypothetical protein